MEWVDNLIEREKEPACSKAYKIGGEVGSVRVRVQVRVLRRAGASKSARAGGPACACRFWCGWVTTRRGARELYTRTAHRAAPAPPRAPRTQDHPHTHPCAHPHVVTSLAPARAPAPAKTKEPACSMACRLSIENRGFANRSLFRRGQLPTGLLACT